MDRIDKPGNEVECARSARISPNLEHRSAETALELAIAAKSAVLDDDTDLRAGHTAFYIIGRQYDGDLEILVWIEPHLL